MNNYFTLFSNCIIVKGHNRSIIADIQNGIFEFVPNDLFRLFKKSNQIDLKEIQKKYKKEDGETINEYFQFIHNKGMGFWHNNENKNLIPLNEEWDSYANVTNCFIEFNKCFFSEFKSINNSLNNLNCIALEMSYSYKFDCNDIINTLLIFSKSKLRSISLIISYNKCITEKFLILLSKKNSRLSSIYIHDCPENIKLKTDDILANITLTKKKIKNNLFCGAIKPSFFSINIEHYTESINHNSCLNRKISIDTNGNIKNCPSMPQSFGNIKDTTLEEALNHKDFKKYWNITKDQIDVCKDCEFRYICTDCRAYVENPEDDYSKPLKCGYSPYTNKWEEWSTNPLKQKAIEYYGMQELVKKND